MNLYEKVRSHGKRAEAFRIKLTPELAEELLRDQEHQRPVKVHRVAYYRRLIREGKWHYTGQGIVCMYRGSKLIMLDGQHRCRAVIEEGLAVEVLIVLDVQEDAWRHMDQGTGRTGADMLDVPNRGVVASALQYIWRERRGLSHQEGGADNMRAHEADAMLATCPGIVESAAWAEKHREIRMAKAMLAYCYWRACQYDPEMSRAFFERLGDGLVSDKRSSIYILRERLIQNAVSKARLGRTELLALIIKAWSAHVAGRPIGALRWRTLGDHAESFPEWPMRPEQTDGLQ